MDNKVVVVKGKDPYRTTQKALQHFSLKRLKGRRILIKPNGGRLASEPKDYLKWENPFEPPSTELSLPFPDLVIHDQGSCSACLSTIFVLLHRYKGELMPHRLGDNKVHIGIGKHLDHLPRGALRWLRRY